MSTTPNTPYRGTAAVHIVLHADDTPTATLEGHMVSLHEYGLPPMISGTASQMRRLAAALEQAADRQDAAVARAQMAGALA